jgi:glycosyltransferase involved in cell wall biosynthesis
VPFGVTVHAVDLFVPRPGLAEVLRAADPVITVAEHHARVLATYGVTATVVRCGVEPTAYRCADPGGNGPLRVVSVGRNVPKKGLDDLVAAVRAEPPIRLRVVADVPSQGDRIEVGALPPGEVPAALAAAHLFALPCRIAPDGDRDGVPVAIIEAMAAGLPVLTTPIAGIPEVVDDEVGWMVPPDDPDALGKALRAIAADPAGRARRGEAARRRVIERGWTVEAQADGVLAAWGVS